ncbi:MAG: aldo/keto reductase [Candidatus Binatia bacterium]
MDYLPLGRTAVKVSRLCLGTMNFGPQTSEADSFAIMDAALGAGINFFDTANTYGRALGPGATEQILGRWFAQRQCRDRVVLATKVYGRVGDGPNDQGLSAYHITRACEASLQRLQTDRIDLYQMHHVDRSAPWDEVWEAVGRLVQAGKVIYVGSSNFAGWHLAQANAAAAARHFLGLVSEQSLYNLRSRTIELEVIPACRALGLALLPWSPLAGGLLAGVLRDAGNGRRASDFVRERIASHRAQLEAYEALCESLGASPADVALAWVLHNPAVTAPIIGPRTLDQLHGALRALELRLDDATLRRLDEIWPGPGGEAPEAYAW